MSFTETLNSYSLVIAFPVLLLSMFVLLPIKRQDIVPWPSGTVTSCFLSSKN